MSLYLGTHFSLPAVSFPSFCASTILFSVLRFGDCQLSKPLLSTPPAPLPLVWGQCPSSELLGHFDFTVHYKCLFTGLSLTWAWRAIHLRISYTWHGPWHTLGAQGLVQWVQVKQQKNKIKKGREREKRGRKGGKEGKKEKKWAVWRNWVIGFKTGEVRKGYFERCKKNMDLIFWAMESYWRSTLLFFKKFFIYLFSKLILIE